MTEERVDIIYKVESSLVSSLRKTIIWCENHLMQKLAKWFLVIVEGRGQAPNCQKEF